MKHRTSIENNTPPIGAPNATATPAALAAVMISRVFTVAVGSTLIPRTLDATELTLTPAKVLK